jgi:glutamate-5-semialdehyde dehydrogenase
MAEVSASASARAATEASEIAQAARDASRVVAAASTAAKDAALRAMSRALAARKEEVLAANRADCHEAERRGLASAVIARLRFGEDKLDSRCRSLEKIAALADPVGQPISCRRRPNGMQVSRVRVPLGVVLNVYEARPHVTINAGAFCLKAGNASILRGGSEAKRCNGLLGELWRQSLVEAGLPPLAIQVISGSHETIGELLQMDQWIDLVIPRGGKGLIEAVARGSRIPVIKHFEGICHVYLDEGCDFDLGLNVALDSKCLMPEVCNAMETLLVAEALSGEMPRIVEAFRRCGVEVRGCERTRVLVRGVKPATEDDWRTEYLDQIVSVRLVPGVAEAVEHVNRFGSHHTDAIVTESLARAESFVSGVDSAVVLVNASTMFCDGESLGMGAEIGISTDKLHARGPMGLEELTSYKFVIRGRGEVMGPPRAASSEPGGGNSN